MSLFTQPTATEPTAGGAFSVSVPASVVLCPARTIVDREKGPTKYRYMQNTGESITYEVNFTRLAEQRGVTIVSASWESDGLTIVQTQLDGDKARVTLRQDGSKGVAQASALQSDGNIRIVYIAARAQQT